MYGTQPPLGESGEELLYIIFYADLDILCNSKQKTVLLLDPKLSTATPWPPHELEVSQLTFCEDLDISFDS